MAITLEVSDGAIDLGSVGVMMVEMARKTALSDGASENAKENWNTIKTWLELERSELGASERDRIGKAWKSYLAIGEAPSHKLQPAFDQFAEDCRADGYDFRPDKPPAVVIQAFSRMMATKDEIYKKRVQDVTQELKNRSPSEAKLAESELKNRSPSETKLAESEPKTEPKQRRKSSSVFFRFFIVFTVVWSIWAFFRSDGEFMAFGIYFEKWHQEYGPIGFFTDFLLPPILLLFGRIAFKWVMRGRQE